MREAVVMPIHPPVFSGAVTEDLCPFVNRIYTRDKDHTIGYRTDRQTDRERGREGFAAFKGKGSDGSQTKMQENWCAERSKREEEEEDDASSQRTRKQTTAKLFVFFTNLEKRRSYFSIYNALPPH
jgi:hypothetical protein